MPHTRESLTDFITRHGGHVASSVSGRTDFLIIGDNPGETKLRAAQEKGIPTLWWGIAEFLGIFESRNGSDSLDKEAAKIIADLVTIMATIVEEFYIHHKAASGYVVNATSTLLLFAWGEATDAPVRALTKPTEEYLAVRNGRSPEQLKEDVQLVMGVLDDLHNTFGSGYTKYARDQWRQAEEALQLAQGLGD